MKNQNSNRKWYSWIGDIINDTLKKRGSDGNVRFSWAKLTMLSAWIIANYMAIQDFIQNGFRWDVFITYVSVATGVKIAESISQKLKPESEYKQAEPNGDEMPAG